MQTSIISNIFRVLKIELAFPGHVYGKFIFCPISSY